MAEYKVSCPKCSEKTEQGGYRWWQWGFGIGMFPIGLALFLAGKKPTVCHKCGHTWNA